MTEEFNKIVELTDVEKNFTFFFTIINGGE